MQMLKIPSYDPPAGSSRWLILDTLAQVIFDVDILTNSNSSRNLLRKKLKRVSKASNVVCKEFEIAFRIEPFLEGASVRQEKDKLQKLYL